LVKRFLNYLVLERGTSPRTCKRYAHAIKRLKEWARMKRKSLAQLTPQDGRRWRLNMLRNGLSPSTVNTNLIALRMFFLFLLLERQVKSNPFKQVELVPRQEPTQRHLTEEEVVRLLAVPDVSTFYGLLDRALLELMYSSALHPAEVSGLRLGDVDLTRRRVRCIGKGNKERIVPIGSSAAKWLKRYLLARGRLREWRRTRLFFAKEDGSRLSYMYILRHVKAHGMTAGLKDLTPRIIRHTCATHMHERGAQIVHIKALLGHNNDESTRGYTHTSVEHLRRTYDEYHPRAGNPVRSPEGISERRKKRAKIGK
jgi:site-specific recombinase XerD